MQKKAKIRSARTPPLTIQNPSCITHADPSLSAHQPTPPPSPSGTHSLHPSSASQQKPLQCAMASSAGQEQTEAQQQPSWKGSTQQNSESGRTPSTSPESV